MHLGAISPQIPSGDMNLSSGTPFLEGIWHPFSGVCIYMHLRTICILGLYLHQGGHTFYPPLPRWICLKTTLRRDSPLGTSFRGDMAPPSMGYAFICISGLYLPCWRPDILSPSFQRDMPSDYPSRGICLRHPF